MTIGQSKGLCRTAEEQHDSTNATNSPPARKLLNGRKISILAPVLMRGGGPLRASIPAEVFRFCTPDQASFPQISLTDFLLLISG